MTTITSVEQLRELPEDTVIRERGGSVLQKDGDGWETTYGSFVDHEGVQLPAQTLHPRTISAGDVERLARSLWIDDAPGRPQAGHEWDSLSMFPPVYERYRSLARAALAALGFEVVDHV